MLEFNINNLEKVSEDIPVENIETEGRAIYNQLVDAYIALGGGAGLAAPQIGINKRIFLWTKDRTLGTLNVAINPKIRYKNTGDPLKSIEGCYSLPQYIFEMDRFKELDMMFYNLNGDLIHQKFSGFEGIVVQHEFDHLNGKLLCHTGKLKRKFESNPEYVDYIKKMRKNDQR